MAPPTRQFHRLSIGQDMPETRAQSSRTARVAGRSDPADMDDNSGPGNQGDDDSPEESSSEEEEDEDEEEGENEEEDDSSEEESTRAPTVRTRSGITYDLRHLDTESEAKALVGLTGQFEVVNCGVSSSGYDFQLLDRPRVHIGPGPPTCTCTTFQTRPGVACHHIFVSTQWLRICGVETEVYSKCSVTDGLLLSVAPRSALWLLPH